MVAEIWNSTAEEFKRTLDNLRVVSPGSDVKLADLIRNFEEELDKEIEKKLSRKEVEAFPKVPYLNGFRQTLEDYIQEKRGMAPRRPGARFGKHARKYEHETEYSGHNWV